MTNEDWRSGECAVRDATVNQRSVDALAKGLASGAISRRRAEMPLASTNGIMVLKKRGRVRRLPR
jgi:hypothetical protein